MPNAFSGIDVRAGVGAGVMAAADGSLVPIGVLGMDDAGGATADADAGAGDAGAGGSGEQAAISMAITAIVVAPDLRRATGFSLAIVTNLHPAHGALSPGAQP